jgi:hypothetical protein
MSKLVKNAFTVVWIRWLSAVKDNRYICLNHGKDDVFLRMCTEKHYSKQNTALSTPDVI